MWWISTSEREAVTVALIQNQIIVILDPKNSESHQVELQIWSFLMLENSSSEYKMGRLWCEGQKNQCQGVWFVTASLPENKQYESCLTRSVNAAFLFLLGQLLAFFFFPFFSVLSNFIILCMESSSACCAEVFSVCVSQVVWQWSDFRG